MQLTHEQTRQIQKTLLMSRASIRQLAIVASDIYSQDAKARGRLLNERDVTEYVERVASPLLRPIDEALDILKLEATK